MEVADCKKRIMAYFRDSNARPNYVLYMKSLLYGAFRPNSLEDMEIFTKAVNELIKEGKVIYDNSNPGLDVLRLTINGYNSIFPKEVDDNELKAKIISLFKNCRPNEIVSMRKIRFSFLPTLNPKEQDHFPMVCNELIREGLLKHKTDNIDRLELTPKGYEEIHK